MLLPATLSPCRKRPPEKHCAESSGDGASCRRCQCVVSLKAPKICIYCFSCPGILLHNNVVWRITHPCAWTHWRLSPGPSACGADVIPLHHVPLDYCLAGSGYTRQPSLPPSLPPSPSLRIREDDWLHVSRTAPAPRVFMGWPAWSSGIKG